MSAASVVCFRDLETWQAAMDLAVTAHGLASHLPPLHRFELGSQLRRAANSVPSNVAEGHGNGGTRVYLRHVRIALGSLAELGTLLELMLRLKLTDKDHMQTAQSQMDRTGQLLHGLQRALKRRVARMTVSIGSSLSVVLVTGAWWLGAF